MTKKLHFFNIFKQLIFLIPLAILSFSYGDQKNPNVQTNNQTITASLHYFTWIANESKIKTLIENGADINSINKDGDTALHLAVQKELSAIVKLLLSENANPNILNNDGDTALKTATWKEFPNIEIISELLKAGVDSEAINESLSIVFWKRSLDIEKHLFKTDVDSAVIIKKAGITIPNSASNEEFNVLEALTTAYREKILEMMKLFLSAGADPNIIIIKKFDSTIMHESAREGYNDMLEVLIPYVPDLNIRNKYDNTPLNEAIQGKNPNTAEILLSAGADPNIQNEDGYSALHLASQQGFSELVQKFIQKKAKINISNESGYTPLHEAARLRHLNVVQKLLSAGANPNIQNMYGHTPLHDSVQTDYPDPKIVSALLSENANPLIRDKHFRTPYDIAQEERFKNKETEKILQLLDEKMQSCQKSFLH